jgi:adenylate cyclase
MPSSSGTSELEMAVRKVTVLYTDLRAFCEFNRGLGSTELAAFMNTYYDDAATIIRDTGGTVDKFVGDSVIAHFNSPTIVARSEQRAVNAALQLKAKIAERWPELPISIGIATGKAVVGYFGPSFQRFYTAFGDVVTRALVLERRSHFTGYKILIDAATQNKLGSHFPVDEHPSFEHPSLEGAKVFEVGLGAIPILGMAKRATARTRQT